MKKRKIIASIEARMTSSRLPGKVLMEAIAGMSMLEFMIKRVQISEFIDDIIIATTINKTDDPIIELCKSLNVKYYRGSEEDVLGRVLNAHNAINSDIIVELTGDCPLIDFTIMDNIIKEYLNGDFAYVSNSHVRSYPDGLDVQVFSTNLLKELSKKTHEAYDRENVSSYIYRSGEYSLKAVVAEKELYWPELRITLDDAGDYELIRNIINHFYRNDHINFKALDIVRYIRANIGLLELNKDARVNVSPYQKIAKENEQE